MAISKEVLKAKEVLESAQGAFKTEIANDINSILDKLNNEDVAALFGDAPQMNYFRDLTSSLWNLGIGLDAKVMPNENPAFPPANMGIAPHLMPNFNEATAALLGEENV